MMNCNCGGVYKIGPAKRCTKCGKTNKPGAIAKETASLECQSMIKQYGIKGDLFPNIKSRIEAIGDASTTEEAERLGSRVVNAMFAQCLAAWAEGRAAGPETPESLEVKAKKAESLAKMLLNKDDDAGAERQKKRAQELREKAKQGRPEVIITESPKGRRCGKCGGNGHNSRTCTTQTGD
jgi:hypothetical protein